MGQEDKRLVMGHAMRWCSYTFQHFAFALLGLLGQCSRCYSQTGTSLLWAKTNLLRTCCWDGGSCSHLSGLCWALPPAKTIVLYWGRDGCWAGWDWSIRALQCSGHLESQILVPGRIRLLFSVLIALGFVWWCVSENLALSLKLE